MRTQYKIGDIIEGQVTGVQDYGIFVQLDETIQGLVHISECRHGFVTDLRSQVTIGEKLIVIIIDIDQYTQQLSLSLRALQPLRTPPFPAKIKKIRRSYGPRIGFKTLEKAMPGFIQEGMEIFENDRFDLL